MSPTLIGFSFFFFFWLLLFEKCGHGNGSASWALIISTALMQLDYVSGKIFLELNQVAPKPSKCTKNKKLKIPEPLPKCCLSGVPFKLLHTACWKNRTDTWLVVSKTQGYSNMTNRTEVISGLAADRRHSRNYWGGMHERHRHLKWGMHQSAFIQLPLLYHPSCNICGTHWSIHGLIKFL